MQRARLFCTTLGSPRRAIPFLALIAVFVAALVFGSGGRLALAQTPPTPGPVTDVKVVAVSATRVTVSWKAPAAGECPVTGYSVRYGLSSSFKWHVSLGPDIQGFKSITITQLSKNAEYHLDIRAISKHCGSASYGAASTPVTITFRTLAEDPLAVEPPAVEPPPEPKKRPKRPRNLTVSGSGDSMAIRWTAPENNEKRCALSSYTVYIVDRTDPINSNLGTLTPGIVIRHSIRGTSANVPGLTSGHKYGVYVASFSTECKKYSTVVKKVYTHP